MRKTERKGEKRLVQQRLWEGKGWRNSPTLLFVARSGESLTVSPPALSSNQSQRAAFFLSHLHEWSYINEVKQHNATDKRHWNKVTESWGLGGGRPEGAEVMEANSKKHRFRKGRSATFSIDGFNITIGKKKHARNEETVYRLSQCAGVRVSVCVCVHKDQNTCASDILCFCAIRHLGPTKLFKERSHLCVSEKLKH